MSSQAKDAEAENVKEEKEKATGAIDNRMKEDEQEMVMLKDVASLVAQAKKDAKAEAKQKQMLESKNIVESLMSRALPTGALKLKIGQGNQDDNKNDRSKGSIAADRLMEDKAYLSSLANCLTQRNGTNCIDGVDMVYKDVKNTAEEALQFLRDREDFWDQLAMGHDKKSMKGTRKYKPTKALESTRLLF